MLISVITPSYNRAYILTQCYESLKCQTDKDFEWIVVDDGSTDNTEQTIAAFKAEEVIKIKYIKQSNGGKHRAHNTGVLVASGELSVCLDSDDALSPNAIARAKETWDNRSYDFAIGILAYRGDFNRHTPICSDLPLNLDVSTMGELRDKYGFTGDTVLFFKTDILKNNLFKEFSGEKFLTENNLYTRLDHIGPMILLPEVLYYCEYLPDGLTAKYKKILAENPKGTADTYYLMAVASTSLKSALKYAIVSQAYLSLVEDKSELQFKEKRLLMVFARLVAPFYRSRYIYQNSGGNK